MSIKYYLLSTCKLISDYPPTLNFLFMIYFGGHMCPFLWLSFSLSTLNIGCVWNLGRLDSLLPGNNYDVPLKSKIYVQQAAHERLWPVFVHACAEQCHTFFLWSHLWEKCHTLTFSSGLVVFLGIFLFWRFIVLGFLDILLIFGNLSS